MMNLTIANPEHTNKATILARLRTSSTTGRAETSTSDSRSVTKTYEYRTGFDPVSLG
jgi:hypothetical protein